MREVMAEMSQGGVLIFKEQETQWILDTTEHEFSGKLSASPGGPRGESQSELVGGVECSPRPTPCVAG